MVALGTILWASHREVEATLLEVGRERASEGAGQIATLLERLLAEQAGAAAELRTDPAVQALLLDPGEGLTPPAGEPPDREGLSELRTAGERNYFELVTEVREGPAEDAARLGWVRQFGGLEATGLRISDLLGTNGELRVGSPGQPGWTDLSRTVPAPPLGGDDAASGRRWVDAAIPVEGSPWMVWAGFPRDLIVAPATAFTRRMILVALLFLAGGVVLTGFVAFHLTEPLHGLTRATRMVAAGDYSRRVEGSDRPDEIGRLSDAFNRMADEVEQAYADLRKSYDDTHFTLRAAGIGVWEVDLATGEMACSPSLAAVYGLDEARLPHSRDDFLAHVHPQDRPAVREVLDGRTPGEVVDVEHRALNEAGHVRWIEGKGRVKGDVSGRPTSVLGISMDVTAQRSLEARLRQAEKMEAIGQLAGGVAHDFNNLLTSILSHGSLVLEDLPESAPGRADLTEILRAGESAAALTRQLLTFSRRQVVHPQVVDVREAIEKTGQLLRRLIPEDIELVVREGEPVPPVEIDPGHLEQVILNLAINARDAMQDGGTLTIRVTARDLDDAHSQDGTPIEPGRYVELLVDDTGTGMTPEVVARLFEPFFTTKPPGKGTGLGMATVFGIVKKSGGHIHVYSEVGQGTTFRVYLPVSSKGVRGERVTKRPASAVRGGTESVLVVEDDEPVREVASMILERAGYRVAVASNGEEALELLDAAVAPPDLLVSDVVMPGLTGPELWHEIRARHPGVRVLFTSGYSDADLGQRGLDDEAATFLETPYTPSELADKVREALGRAATA